MVRPWLVLCSLASIIALAVALALSERSGMGLGPRTLLLVLLHLTVLPALLGVIEASMSAPALRSVGHEVPPWWRWLEASYLAWWVTLIGLELAAYTLGPFVLGMDPLGRLPWMLGALYVGAFGLTLLIKWLYIRWAVGRRAPEQVAQVSGPLLRRLLPASALTFALAAAPYVPDARIGALTQTRPSTDLSFVQNRQALVVYRSPAGDCVWALRPDGGAPEPLPGSWSEALRRLERSGRRRADTRGGLAGHWEYASGGGPYGLCAKARDGTVLRLGLWLPFARWEGQWGRVPILPGDQVICRFGQYVAVVDLNTRQVAALARGMGPVVFEESTCGALPSEDARAISDADVR